MSNAVHSGKADRKDPFGESGSHRHAPDFIAGVQRDRRYKLIPEDWKALPKSKYRQAISHIESVLFEISANGKPSVTSLEGKIAIPTLNRWAGHIRAALKELTTGQ